MALFSRILVANRGEIACRVIRACQALGIQTVAVYSEADQRAPHVAMADTAVLLGPAPAAQSYLNAERVLEAARATGTEAIHPGYGFLSENAAFARRCAEQGLVFIGPPPEAISAMGRKTEARALVVASGVPTVPGTDGDLGPDVDPLIEAERIGYPLLVKASAGGGGIGMSIAESPDQLAAAVKTARSRAQRSFADPGIFLERLLRKPRHVEVQVFGDGHGNLAHLFERECSVQRRYQKVIEEAPSPAVDDALRAHLARVALNAARTVRYVNAGTVEGMLDEGGNYYFLEMNTRLQVEHPVTEMVTGLDLVQAQIRVAAGERLPWSQDDIRLNGHAVECRVYAEDPVTFFPSPGTLTRYVEPPRGEHVRVDSGVREGGEVTVYYDPLLAKVIAWGETRHAAIQRMREALSAFEVEGVKTNIPLHLRVLASASFLAGTYDTNLLSTLDPAPQPSVHSNGAASSMRTPR